MIILAAATTLNNKPTYIDATPAIVFVAALLSLMLGVWAGRINGVGKGIEMSKTVCEARLLGMNGYNFDYGSE